MQQENTEIHGNTQLQYGCQRLGNIGNLSQENVAAEIIGNREQNAQHKNQWHGSIFQKQKHHHQGQYP